MLMIERISEITQEEPERKRLIRDYAVLNALLPFFPGHIEVSSPNVKLVIANFTRRIGQLFGEELFAAVPSNVAEMDLGFGVKIAQDTRMLANIDKSNWQIWDVSQLNAHRKSLADQLGIKTEERPKHNLVSILINGENPFMAVQPRRTRVH